MKPHAFFISLACLFLLLGLFGCISPAPETKEAQITFPDGYLVSARLALTGEEQMRGLSGTESLPAGTGMLFVLDSPSRPGFWMPDMNYPIDMIFLDENFTVVDINRNAQPCIGLSNCPSFTPRSECSYVLEVNANESVRHNASIGSHLVAELPKD